MSIAYSIVFPDQFQWCRSSSTMLGRDIIRFPVIKMRPCKRFHSLIQVQVSDRPAINSIFEVCNYGKELFVR